jgi:putative flippase GtrA
VSVPRGYASANGGRNRVPPNLTVEIARFIKTGAARTLFTLGLYQILLLAMSYRLAYTLSFTIGILLAAFVNAFLVFDSSLDLRSLTRFALFYLASYAVGLGLLSMLVAEFAVSPVLAPFMVIALMLPINFIGSRITLQSL